MRDYRKIDAWKFADDLVVEIYKLTRALPKEELYGLSSQLRRAASSVPANIAEGSARESKRDYLHFLYIARGSLTETQYFVHLAERLGYLNSDVALQISGQVQLAFRCLHGLISAVEKEAGKFSRIVAATTSLLAVFVAHALVRAHVA